MRQVCCMGSLSLDTRFGRLGVVVEDGAIVRLTWEGTDEGEATSL